LTGDYHRAEDVAQATFIRLYQRWGRVAVAGYVAGGRATVDALRRCDFDVLATNATPRRRDTLRHALRLLAVRR